MSDATNLETARCYITALSAGADGAALAGFCAEDVVQEEFPNRLVPQGATRSLDEIREARAFDPW